VARKEIRVSGGTKVTCGVPIWDLDCAWRWMNNASGKSRRTKATADLHGSHGYDKSMQEQSGRMGHPTTDHLPKSPTSFSGTTHTQGAAADGNVTGEDAPPTAAKVEAPRGTPALLRRTPRATCGQSERFSDFVFV